MKNSFFGIIEKSKTSKEVMEKINSIKDEILKSNKSHSIASIIEFKMGLIDKDTNISKLNEILKFFLIAKDLVIIYNDIREIDKN